MPPSCKYFFGKVFAHLAGALAVSAASAEYSNLSEQLLGGTSLLIHTLISLAILIGLLFGTQLTRPGGFAKYGCFIAFAFWIGQTLKPYVAHLQDKGTLTRILMLTAGVFAAMTALGFYDSGNLLGLGPYLLAGLLGLIIAQALLLALGTPEEKRKGIQWLHLIGVALFSLFTAYDIQVLRVNARLCRTGKNSPFQPDYPVESLGIYLDFINLFVNMGGDN
jgi:FtsH-binding integral membrane protein